MNKQPKALYLLNFISMWECFSYYGMRVLLVLYMSQELNFGDGKAFALYALYTTLVEFGGLFGGIAADRWLGLKPAIMIGGWTIAIGHVCLAIPGFELGLYLGLGFIIAGTGLFRSNIPALLGKFYHENDPRRDAGFTLYYTGINIGGFLATIFCGLVGELYGWHAGFSLAALGMLAGNVVLCFECNILKVEEPQIVFTKIKAVFGAIAMAVATIVCAAGLYFAERTIVIFPLLALFGLLYIFRQVKSCAMEEKKGLIRLVALIGFLIVFYGCEEQLGSTLMLFFERHVNRETMFGLIPSASLVTFNPLTILVCGPILSQILAKTPLKAVSKIGISFLLMGIAYFILCFGCLQVSVEQTVSLYFVIVSIVLIAVGELFMGPTIYAEASQATPKNLQGLTMGLVTMGFSLANLFSGYLSQMMTVNDEVNSLEVYTWGFEMIAAATLLLAVGTLFGNKILKLRVQS